MELKNFQLDVPGRGVVDVEFTLHFNNNSASVNEIKVHADFDSGLPHRVELKLHDNAWRLHYQQPVMKDNEVVVVDQYVNDGISSQIVARLLEFRNEARVN